MKIHLFFGYDNNAMTRVMCDSIILREPVSVHHFPELYFGMPVHPKVQLKLIEDLMNEFKGFTTPTVIFMTTHSEHIMLWLLREVKFGRLSAQDITVTWVFGEIDPRQWIDISNTDEIKTLDLRLDSEGDFIDKWPNGFFNERMELLFDEPE